MMKIMLVDDNEIDLFLHSKMVQATVPDAEIIKFSNPAEALKFLDTNALAPKLILLDIQMPDIDGFAFLSAYDVIQSRTLSDSIIYMVSSSLDFGDINRAKANPLVFDFIKKPLMIPVLKAAMQRDGLL